MGQQEVYQVLLELRKKSNKWYTTKQIKERMFKQGFSDGYVRGVGSDLLRLAIFKLIKVKGVGIWEHHKEFQAFTYKTIKKRVSK